jgi:hypothetical protein
MFTGVNTLGTFFFYFYDVKRKAGDHLEFLFNIAHLFLFSMNILFECHLLDLFILAPAFEGRKEIWDALRGACYAIEQNDTNLAQSSKINSSI